MRNYATLTNETCVSPYNGQSIKENNILQRSIIIRDNTLREGEQASFSGFSIENSVVLAKKLDEIGVDHIQVGYPGYSKEQNKIFREIRKLNLKAKIEGLCLIFIPEWKEILKASVELGVDIISVTFGMSDIRLKAINKTREEALDRCLEAIRYANTCGCVVKFSPTDTTRMDLIFLIKAYKEAIKEGAKMLSIADTVGAASPSAIKFMVEQVKKSIPKDITLSVHCHNDFGLAIANSIAAVEAGADAVDVVVNGLGERAGNASLTEISMILKYLYNCKINVDTEKLFSISKYVSQITGIPIPHNSPFVGKNAFTHIMGTHQWGVRKNWYNYESVKPNLVGNVRRLPLGVLSDHRSVKGALKENGVKTDNYPELTFKDIATEVRNKAYKTGKFVKVKELIEIWDIYKDLR
ncbi:MAG TPA: homoaconitate hydratase [Atribacterota bacterium]|nr:homoaconitate hydratase [Atribacterota bacterium]